ncbi:MAG: rRNA maturation RNase YbeY [Eubacteriales bacterium]
MTFYIENVTDVEFDFDIEEIAKLVANEVLDDRRCPYETEINLLITNSDEIQEYNKSTRNIDKPTDVLSFPGVDFEVPADFSLVEDSVVNYFNPESGELLLGDIVISVEKLEEQASAYGHSIKREFAFLIAHSMLHLCGYDHMEEDDAKEMEQLQEQTLQKLNITRD